MQAKRYTHAEHSLGGPRHVSEIIPNKWHEAARLSKQVQHMKGQSHVEATKKICRLLQEGLEDLK